MSARLGLGGVLLASLISVLSIACGGKRAPFIDTNPPDPGAGGAAPDDMPPVSDGGEPAAGGAGAGSGPVEDELGVFDPNEVYLYGTLIEGTSGKEAVAHWSKPDLYTIGFPRGVDVFSLQLWKGRLLYSISGVPGIRSFKAERKTSIEETALTYPEMPEANDPIVSTPPCLAEDGPGPTQFLTSPDDRLIYRCPDLAWYEDGELVYDDPNMDKPNAVFGYDGLVLFSRNVGMTVLNLADGQSQSVAASPAVVALRAHPDGFHAALISRDPLDPKYNAPELWLIPPNGQAMKIGAYELHPEGLFESALTAKLASNDELFSRTYQGNTDVVVRRTLDGMSEQVYSEADDPRVKMHMSTLFTGP